MFQGPRTSAPRLVPGNTRVEATMTVYVAGPDNVQTQPKGSNGPCAIAKHMDALYTGKPRAMRQASYQGWSVELAFDLRDYRAAVAKMSEIASRPKATRTFELVVGRDINREPTTFVGVKYGEPPMTPVTPR